MEKSTNKVQPTTGESNSVLVASALIRSCLTNDVFLQNVANGKKFNYTQACRNEIAVYVINSFNAAYSCSYTAKIVNVYYINYYSGIIKFNVP